MAKKKKKKMTKIKLALINAAIAGALVFFGSFTDGNVNIQGVCAAFAAAVIIFLTKMKDFFKTSVQTIYGIVSFI